MSVDSARFTLDTNIPVYSVDNAAGARHQLATVIVDRAAERDCFLSLQAISEFYAVVTRKGMMPAADAAGQAADWLDIFPCAASSSAAVRAALMDAAAGRAAYWDALLIATAREAGCSLILTEDLSDGATLGGVKIHNPFTARPGLSRLARDLLGIE